MTARLGEAQRHLVAVTWDFRASAERSARLRFLRLHDELRATDAPEVILEMVTQAIDDETRHIVLCDDLAAAFGWDKPPSPPTAHHPIGPKDAPLKDRLLYEMVAFGCVTETINASMLLAIQRRVKDPLVKEAVHTILKDEVNHSKLGWAYLQHARNEGRGDFLSAWLKRMFTGAGVEEIYTPDSGERDTEEMADYGELGFAQRTDIFRAAVRDIIFPGLTQMGLDISASRTWLQTYEPEL